MRRNLSETESATLTWKFGDLRHLDVDQLSDSLRESVWHRATRPVATVPADSSHRL